MLWISELKTRASISFYRLNNKTFKLLDEFLLIAIAHLFAVASPGADFAVVLRNTLQSGKRAGVATAVGIGLGILVHVGYTLLGVSLVLSQSPILFKTVKYLGAAYLLWLAFKSFKSRKSMAHKNAKIVDEKISILHGIKQGFIVNVLNPKVTIFFVALFTSVISPQTPIWLQLIYGLWLSLYTIAWFMFVAWGFSREWVLAWYRGNGHLIDWGMGVVLCLIAIRLLL